MNIRFPVPSHVISATEVRASREGLRVSNSKRRGVAPRLRVVAVAATMWMLGLGAAGAAPAYATVVTYCGFTISAGYYCPVSPYGGQSGIPRHTYVTNRGQWGTVHHPGCDVRTWIYEFVAYTSTNGSLKYSTFGCNEAFYYHPNNTELLRAYLSHDAPTPRTMYGWAAY